MSGAKPLAVMVTGTFPDTFADGEAPAWPTAPPPDGTEDPLNQIQSQPAPVDPAPGKLFLVGSAKMFDDNILAAGQNALLLLNAVDFLAGSQDLLNIRSKTLTQRVIKNVDAKEKMFWRIVAVILVPVILAIFGIMRAGMRRKEAARYRETIQHATGSAG